MSKPPETFATTRLLLRPPRLADAPAIHSNYAHDSEATRYPVLSVNPVKPVKNADLCL
jgi:RimJ/RimL family protein N-acetyltransferase